MNQDQRDSLIRSLLKLAGTALAAHGLTASAAWVNSEDALGAIVLLVGLWQSHHTHGSGSTGNLPVPPGNLPGGMGATPPVRASSGSAEISSVSSGRLPDDTGGTPVPPTP